MLKREKCRVCKGNLGNERQWIKYKECPKCGCLSLVEVSKVDYGRSYYQRAINNFFLEWLAFWDRYWSIKLRPQDRVLEIGFGNGKFASRLFDKGVNVYGVEVSAAARQDLGKKIGKNRVFKTMDELEDKFDVVVAYHVLEHQDNPRGFIESIKKVLNPGGRLIMRIPRYNSREASWAKDKWYHLDYPYHKVLFTDYGLVNMIKSLGFKWVKCRYDMIEYRQVIGYSLGWPKWIAIILTPLLWCGLNSKKTYGVVELEARVL